MVDPGCFRCHDGNHVAKNGETISNDCSLCHDILAYGETHPKILGSIGITNTAMAPR
jgi:cytochrome c2